MCEATESEHLIPDNAVRTPVYLRIFAVVCTALTIGASGAILLHTLGI